MLLAEQSDEQEKTFKDYQPSYLHVDVNNDALTQSQYFQPGYLHVDVKIGLVSGKRKRPTGLLTRGRQSWKLVILSYPNNRATCTWTSIDNPVSRAGKDQPGYLHVDVKYLSMMPHDPHKRYLLVAIDRATRWVYFEVVNDKSAATAANFVEQVRAKYLFRIKKILTDNDKEFTDRFTSAGER